MTKGDFPIAGLEPESVKFYRVRLRLRLWPKLSTPTDSDSGFDSDSAPLKKEYHRENIMVKEGLDAFIRTAADGSNSGKTLAAIQDRAMFIQDGAPPHTVHVTQ